jgi:(E)-4-hydroxy-3-methylbut-2-enyl-diphosphate synthase
LRCVKAGAELVRITAPTPKHATAIGEIKKQLETKHRCHVPLIADIHFAPAAAFEALKWADKIRLNPGNFLDGKAFRDLDYSDESYKKEIARIEESLLPFIEAIKKAKKPMRLGANHGSLSDRILGRYGDTPFGMVESAMEYLRIFKKHDFDQIIVAMKAADPLIMIEANRLLVDTLAKEGMDYPIHVCYSILQATRRRITKTEFVSCPSCGRTLFDLESVTNKIKERMEHLKGVRIAVMGCIVNGLGEMADADFGYVGGKPGMINLYHKKELVERDVPEAEAIDALVQLIKDKGKWVEKGE